ncbi:hypothetical protein EII17_09660 [Clostridiales bacterium COT073_COT-073]|nr:hypothetical protein EII17_09660 [Clostridiales bacterium COT073_COT-073]
MLFSIFCVAGLLFTVIRNRYFSLKTKLIIHLIAFIAAMLVNYITASGLISGFSQSEISQKYHTLITPAGFAFSIWGVIYGLLFLCLLFWLWKKNDIDQQPLLHQLSPWIWMMLAVNIAWNIVFSLSLIGASLLFILMYWIILLLICHKLKGNLNLFSISFGIHLGWITVASIVNFFAFLVQLNGQDLQSSSALWYNIALLFGILMGFLLIFILKNGAVPLAMAWAYFGIYMKLNSIPDNTNLILKLNTLTGIIFLLGLSLGSFVGLKWRKLFGNKPNQS